MAAIEESASLVTRLLLIRCVDEAVRMKTTLAVTTFSDQHRKVSLPQIF